MNGNGERGTFPVPIHWSPSIDSTQDLAHQMAQAGAPGGTAVAALVQTGGRGTRGRKWVSGAGGLWISVIIRPPSADRVELLAIRIGLALADRLERESGGRLDLRLKWPNDVYASDRKLGGLLAEARWQGEALGWVAVGVGLNLTNDLPSEVTPMPARTADFGWRPLPEALAPMVVEAVNEAGRLTGPLTPDELERFRARHWLAGRRVRRPVPGTIGGITGGGRLVVHADDGPPIELLDSADLVLDR